MDAPEITIVVCTYSRAALLARALSSLKDQQIAGVRYEILVVDDGSTDETRQVVEALALDSPVPLRLIRERGVGVAAARNRGIEEARGDWLAFFDDDQIAEPGWLSALLSCARQHDALYVGGQRVLDLKPEVLQHLSSTSRALLGELLWGDYPMSAHRKQAPAMGSALIHREVFNRVGVFDETLIRGGEDLDLFRRVRMKRIQVWNTPLSVCRHVIPQYRLQDPYLLWVAERTGENFAYRDSRDWGPTRLIAACTARCVRALIVDLPMLWWATLKGNRANATEHRCRIARTIGYFRLCLWLASPQLFPQRAFLAKLEFRTERTAFQVESTSHPAPDLAQAKQMPSAKPILRPKAQRVTRTVLTR